MTTLDSFRPGATWLDTSGEPIQAHGGSIFREGDTYYWYGENKERTKPGSGIWHWGIRLYASRDLYNWENLGNIIEPEPDDATSPFHPARQVDRPHIIFNNRTGKYICWVKILGDVQTVTILEADKITGPYTILRTGHRPLGMSAGDFDLVVDPEGGKAYYYFERVHSELICADLTDDYTDVSGYYSTHFPHPHPPAVREAPAYFRRGSTHYLITSGTSWYYPNPSEIASAATYHGPWDVLGNPHPEDTTGTSFRTQISSVFKHPDKDLYIALGDRWLPNATPAESAKVMDLFDRHFSGDETVREELHSYLGDDDTSVATYVWLPVTFDDGMPRIDWHDKWRIEDFG
ncbi:family 43 glycosylhydrolase [Agromyces albus]|uniref:family 43 glycosylhydrolase n=1 Tax=Agromyces albus TaxID=205332 RepID=UPI00278056E4|nr:family 43 glycosylhydrolase [Agromyces albus]MDQ0577221.1 hypothetical protein [Agromyces albus]